MARSTTRSLWLALLPAVAAAVTLQVGVYGPMTSIAREFVAVAHLLHVDVMKSWDSSLVTDYGAQIVEFTPDAALDNISTQIATSNSEPDVGIASCIELFQGSNGRTAISALVGGYHSAISMPVSTLSSYYEIPMVSYASTSPALSNKDTYPFFSRTCPPDSIQGKGMWRFIKQMMVPQVVYMYAQESYGEGLFSVVSGLASLSGEAYRVQPMGVPYMPSSYDAEVAREKVRLALASNAKVFFLAMTADQGQGLLPVAKQEGMLTTTYQVIGSESLPSSVGTNELIDGYMYFTPQSRGPKWSEFMSMWNTLTAAKLQAATADYGVDLFKVPFYGANNGNAAALTDATFASEDSMPMEAPFLFDAGWAIVQAANQLLTEGSAITGQALLTKIRGIGFEGVSGYVAFDASGDRLASYYIMNLQSGSEVQALMFNAVADSISNLTSSLIWQSGESQTDTVPESLVSCKPGFFKNTNTLLCQECSAGLVTDAAGTGCEQCAFGLVAVDGDAGRTCEFSPIQIGVYGPMTSISADFIGVAAAFDLDFRKNFDQALVTRFGPPIVTLSNLHPNLRVKVQIANSNSNPETGVGQNLAMFQGTQGRDPIVGLVGGYHSGISLPVTSLATQFKVPMVAYGSTSPTLSDKSQYPYFSRTIPPDSIQGAGIWRYIKHFMIPSVTMTYQQESYGEGLFQAVTSQAAAANEAFRVTGVGIAYMPTDYDDAVGLERATLIRNAASKVVVVVLTVDQALKWFPLAESVGLFSTSFQLFGSEAIPGLRFNEPPAGYMWFTPQARGALWPQFEGMWTKMGIDDIYSAERIAHYGLDDFSVTWSASTAVSAPTDGMFDDSSSLPLESPFLFDSAYAFVVAANKMMSVDGVAPADIKGKAFLDEVRAVTFDGITGFVKFDANGDRLASYFLENVQMSGGSRVSERVGTFSAADDTITIFAGKNLVWMTGDTNNAKVPDALTACNPGLFTDPVSLLCKVCSEGLVANAAKDGCEACAGGMVAVEDETIGRHCEYYPVQIGIYGPITSVDTEFLAAAVMFDLDFRKNTEPDLVTRFGPPVVAVSGLRQELRVKVQIGNSNSNPDIGIATNLEFFQGQGGRTPIVGLVGGYHSAISMPVASLATQYKVVQVSWASTSPTLSNKETYPYFLRTVPPDSIQGLGMWAVIKSFKIPSVTFVYAQESYGEGLFQSVNDAAATAQESFRVQGLGVKYMPVAYDREVALQAATQMKGMSSKTIFFAMTKDQGAPLFNVSAQVGILDGTFQLIGSESLPMFVLGYDLIAGYMWMEPISRASLFSSFEAMWAKLTADDVVGQAARDHYGLDLFKVALGADGTKPLPSAAMFAQPPTQLETPFLFDAAYSFVFAANSMMNNGIQVQDIKGKALLDALYTVDFQGVSGRVVFNDVGDRLASYKINNAQPSGGIPSSRRLTPEAYVAAAFSAVTAASFSAADGSISFTPGQQLQWMTGTTGAQLPAAMTACSPGMSKDDNGICQKCQAGYISAGGSAACTKCPAGSRANSPTGATSCIQCDVGYIAASDASTECMICPAGSYSDVQGGVECTKCAQGFFQEMEGKTSCSMCKVNMNTEVLGATSEDECKCEEGLFRDSRSNPRAACGPCLEGMTCPFGSDMKNYWSWESAGRPAERGPFPVLLGSHMALGSDPLSVFHCNVAKKCPGGPPGSCGINVDPTVRSCSHCLPEYFWNGDECEKCADLEVGGFLFPIVPLLLAPVVICGLYYISRDESEKWGTWRNGLAAFAFIVLNHYQISVLISNANLQYANNVISYLDGLTFAEDPSVLFKPQCAGLQGFGGSMAMKASSPLFIALLVLLTFLASRLVKVLTHKNVAFDMNRTLNIYFSLMFTFFAGISAMSLATFKCADNPNGQSTLNKDQSVLCGSGEWGGMAVVAVFAVLLYIFGFGGLFLWAVFRAPKSFHDPVFRRRWKFLFIKFRPDVWWFAVAHCAKGVLMNIGYTFLTLGLAQLYWVIFIVLIYGGLLIVFRPWRHRLANCLDIYECKALLFVCSLLAFYVHGSSEDLKDTESAIAATVMCVNLSPPLVALGLIVKMIYDHTHPASSRARAKALKKLTPALVLYANAPESECVNFMEKVDEWGRYYIFNAMHIISTEFVGDSYKARLSDGKLKSSSSMGDAGGAGAKGSSETTVGAAQLVFL